MAELCRPHGLLVASCRVYRKSTKFDTFARRTSALLGQLRVRFWRFVRATALGAAWWNTIFMGVGYAAAFAAGDTNASVLALKTLAAVIIAEGLALVAWRLMARRGRALLAGSNESDGGAARR